jgi:hypothetical protein
MRSILWDRDVNTHNEAVRYAHGWLAEQGPMGGPWGFPSHPFPIGASLSWIPFIAAGHVEALARRLWDPWLLLNGYSEPYLNWLAVGTATWGGIFVVFSYLLCRFRFSHGIALRAVFGTLLATSAFYYCFRNAGFPHAHSMAAIAFFFWVWVSDPGRRDLPKVGILAVALSAAATIRWQNCLFALAPMIYWTFVSGRWRSRAKGLAASLLLGTLCLILCFPQLVFFRIRGPRWLSLEHSDNSWTWDSPKFFEMLFDREYGIWGWHPFYFLAAIGGIASLALWFVREPADPRFDRAKEDAPPAKNRMIALFLLGGVALIEVYINASYVLWHGGGEYGNRLIVDLLALFVLGFAGIFHLAKLRGRGWRWGLAALWLTCFGWSFALLAHDNPKFTRSPRRLTELISHTTPASSIAQGIAHFDLASIFSGVWLLAILGLSLGGMYAAVLIARGLFVGSKKGAYRIIGGFFAASVFCSLWFWTDLRRVDLALFLDDRTWHGKPENQRQVDLVRQAFNSDLAGWYPPGYENFLPPGKRRMNLFLHEATPEFETLLPVSWPEPNRIVTYLCERAIVLSRVHSPRPLPMGEPIARIQLERFVPPTMTEWTLLAGVDTDTPDSLRLPPASPDWWDFDVSSVPRYFAAYLPTSPTQEMERLEISLIPKDVTLEIGAMWFSTPTTPRYFPALGSIEPEKPPHYDRWLFGQENLVPLDFPTRLNEDVSDATRFLFPRPHEKEEPVRRFRFFRDPWRLAGTVPIRLHLSDVDDSRPADWHILDWREPSLEIPIRERRVSAAHVALCAGPIPELWTHAPLVNLEMIDEKDFSQKRRVYPGRDLSFWNEPYRPASRLAWFEKRGFYPPVGVSVFRVEGFQETAPKKLRIRLSSRGIETGAQVAVLGITLELAGD